MTKPLPATDGSRRPFRSAAHISGILPVVDLPLPPAEGPWSKVIDRFARADALTHLRSAAITARSLYVQTTDGLSSAVISHLSWFGRSSGVSTFRFERRHSIARVFRDHNVPENEAPA